jgi:hypothetical protein
LRKAGIPVQIELTREGDFTFESGRVAAKQILDLQNRPTAIVASNDDMASGVVWVAQQRRLELPGDLSVAGFDDTPTALKSWPPLTVIRQPIDRMVEHGVSLLLAQCERLRCRCHKMSFSTIRSLSARPRRRLVLGRDGEIGPISPNEIDDLLEQTTARPEASTSNSVFPEGGRLMAVVESYKDGRNDWLLGPVMKLIGSNRLSADELRDVTTLIRHCTRKSCDYHFTL